MKTFAFMLVLTAIYLMTAGRGNAAENQPGNKILVAYFSWGGNTRGIAREIHKKVGGDLFEIEPVKPYSSNYNTVLDEAQREQREAARPALKTHVQNMGQYDVVFIGYPNWWASIPMPIASFLEEYDFSGKKIVPFCSHGGGRLGQSVSAITKLCPQSTILEALSVHYSGGGSLGSDIDAWLRKIGIDS
jgi:flavodoxin